LLLSRPMHLIIAMFRPRMISWRIGYLLEEPTFKKSCNWMPCPHPMFARCATRMNSNFVVMIAFISLSLVPHAVPNVTLTLCSILSMYGMENAFGLQISCKLDLLLTWGIRVPPVQVMIMEMCGTGLRKRALIWRGQIHHNFKLFTPTECTRGVYDTANAQMLQPITYSFFSIASFQQAIGNHRQSSHLKSLITSILKQWSVKPYPSVHENMLIAQSKLSPYPHFTTQLFSADACCQQVGPHILGPV
jgi:hypothetical protein